MRSERMPPKALLWRGLEAALLLTILSMTGCRPSAPPPEPVEITFAHHESNTAYYQGLLDAFTKANPHIAVKLTDADERRWSQSERIDCFEVTPYEVTSAFLLATERELFFIRNLDELIAKDQTFDQSDFYPGPMGMLTIEDKVWGIPSAIDPYVLYFNKDLFDQKQVPYPKNGWSRDDFIKTAIQLSDPAAKVWGYVPVNSLVDAVLFVYQHDGKVVDDLDNPSQFTFTDPRTVEALNWFSDLFHKYRVSPASAKEMGQNARNYQVAGLQAIYASQVGMWQGSFYERGGERGKIGSPWPFRWGMVSLPKGVRSVTLAEGLSYAISTSTDHPEACWQWISSMSQQISADSIYMPPRRSLVESGRYTEVVGEETAALARQALEDVVLPAATVNSGQNLNHALELFEDGVDKIIAGTWTPQEAMDWVQEYATQ